MIVSEYTRYALETEVLVALQNVVTRALSNSNDLKSPSDYNKLASSVGLAIASDSDNLTQIRMNGSNSLAFSITVPKGLILIAHNVSGWSFNVEFGKNNHSEYFLDCRIPNFARTSAHHLGSRIASKLNRAPDTEISLV